MKGICLSKELKKEKKKIVQDKLKNLWNNINFFFFLTTNYIKLYYTYNHKVIGFGYLLK